MASSDPLWEAWWRRDRETVSQRAYEDRLRRESQARQDRVIADFREAQERANAANLERYGEGLSIYEDMTARFQPGQAYSPTYQESIDVLQRNITEFEPGGTYGQGVMSRYDVGARQSRASAYQGLVSSGMSNVTGSVDRQAALDRGRFGQEVEDERTRFLTGARTTYSQSLSDYDRWRREALERTQTGQVGFIERREDVAPDPNLMAQLIRQSSSAYA